MQTSSEETMDSPKKFMSVDSIIDSKELYTLEKKNCKRIIQREKRKYLNEILKETEKITLRVRLEIFLER